MYGYIVIECQVNQSAVQSLVPMPSNDRSRRIPWAVDLVLVLLQSDQPPAAATHRNGRQEATHEDPNKRTFPSAARDRDTHASTSSHHEEEREGQMPTPRGMSEMPAECGEESEDFD